MSSIYEIAGTTSDTFSFNGKLTFLQGDNNPLSYQGEDGDLYFQSNGNMWSKRSGVWINVTSTGLPDPSSGANKLIYSNGTGFAFTTAEVDNEGKLIVDDISTDDLDVNTIEANSITSDEISSDEITAGTVTATTSITSVKPAASSATDNTTVPTIGWVNDPTTATNVVHRSGDETIGGEKTFTDDITSENIIPRDDGTYNLGSSTKKYSNVFGTNFSGTAYRANWGDLAEYYEADNDYPEGTLVEFGGNNEVTIATEDCNAVISSNPGIILNSDNGFEHPCKLALVGRVPVRVIGKVKKFDYLQLSGTAGVAESVPEDDFNFSNVIARALENKDSEEEGLVLCVVKFEL